MLNSCLVSERIAEYRRKVLERPGDTLARYVLAKEYHDRGQHAEAAEEFRELVRQKPDWMKAWIHLGQDLQALGRTDEARATYETALRLAQEQHHEGPEAELRLTLSTL